MSSADESRPPVLRVIRGGASPEEIAALITVIAARAGSGPVTDAEAAPLPSAWSDRAAALRPPHRPGPGAWRASAWPR